MNKINVGRGAVNLFFATLLTLVLVACGGGGGSPSAANDNVGNPSAVATSLADLKNGDCTSPEQNSIFASGLDVTDCSEPHDMEVAGRFELSEAAGVAYPGYLAIRQEAYKQCQPVFESWTGVAFWDSKYDINTITPSASTWDDGDRSVICLIETVDGKPLTAAVGATATAIALFSH